MIPQDVQQIIESYVTQIGSLECLPEISNVHALIQKSDNSLISIACNLVGIPRVFFAELKRFGFSVNQFGFTPAMLVDITHTLNIGIRSHYSTSSVFWLFVTREPNLYHGPYAVLFENSLFFKLLEISIDL